MQCIELTWFLILHDRGMHRICSLQFISFWAFLFNVSPAAEAGNRWLQWWLFLPDDWNWILPTALFSAHVEVVSGDVIMRGCCTKVISDWILSNQSEHQSQWHICFLNTSLLTLALAQPIGFWGQSEHLCVCVRENRQGRGTPIQTHCAEETLVA